MTWARTKALSTWRLNLSTVRRWPNLWPTASLLNGLTPLSSSGGWLPPWQWLLSPGWSTGRQTDEHYYLERRAGSPFRFWIGDCTGCAYSNQNRHDNGDVRVYVP